MHLTRRAYLGGTAVVVASGCLDSGTGGPAIGAVTCDGESVQSTDDGTLPAGRHDWPTAQFDARRSGYNPAVTDAPRSCARLQWSFRTAGYEARDHAAETVLVGGVSVRDGTVYVETRQRVYALNRQRGGEQWHRRLRFPGTATPTVGPDRIYLAGAGGLQALDREDGSEAWSAMIPSPYPGSRTDDWISAAPTLGEQAVFVGTTGGRLLAFDRETGDPRWSVVAPIADPRSPRGPDNTNRFGGATAVTADVVYAGNWNGRLSAHEAATGEQLWATDTGGRIEGSPTVVGGTAYVTTGTELWAVDAVDGSRQWTYREEPGAAIESVVVADGTLYAAVGPAFGSLSLVALDLDSRTVRWRKPGRPQAPASVANGTVYVGIGHELTAVDADTGETAWRLHLESVLDEAPAVVDGGVLVADRAGLVYGVGRA